MKCETKARISLPTRVLFPCTCATTGREPLVGHLGGHTRSSRPWLLEMEAGTSPEEGPSRCRSRASAGQLSGRATPYSEARGERAASAGTESESHRCGPAFGNASTSTIAFATAAQESQSNAVGKSFFGLARPRWVHGGRRSLGRSCLPGAFGATVPAEHRFVRRVAELAPIQVCGCSVQEGPSPPPILRA